MGALNPQQASPINLTSHTAVAEARPGMPLALAIALALLGLFVTAMAPANAAIISDSFTYTGSFNGSPLSSGDRYAQAFTTTSTGYQLTQVDVKLNLAPSASPPTGGSVLFSVYDVTTFGGSPIPGSQVASLGSYAASSVTANDASYTGQTVSLSSLAVSLSPNTEYYLVLEGSGVTGSDVYWGFFDSQNPGPAVGFPSNANAYLSGAWGPPSQSEPQRMQITAVPEPSTYAMLMAGGMVVVMYRRRRRQQQGS